MIRSRKGASESEHSQITDKAASFDGAELRHLRDLAHRQVDASSNGKLAVMGDVDEHPTLKG